MPVPEAFNKCSTPPGASLARRDYAHQVLHFSNNDGARAVPPDMTPRLASVLLADDLSSWPHAPHDPGALKMWTRLRVTTLGAIWQTRCARADGRASESSFARQAVSLAVANTREISVVLKCLPTDSVSFLMMT